MAKRQGKVEEGISGGWRSNAEWCVVCALEYFCALLGKASKIWEVCRKSTGSPQEVRRKSAGSPQGGGDEVFDDTGK